MDKFEKKYGIVEDEGIKNFHRSRRMFAVKDNQIYIADENLPYSHAVWFEKMGWIKDKDDSVMAELVRGFVDDKGDIYFYTGYQMGITQETENVFFTHLKELSQQLNLKADSKVCGGLIKVPQPQRFPPQKVYGTVEEVIKKLG